MRNLIRIALSLLLGSVAATAQQYTISTFAGKSQPVYYPPTLTPPIFPFGIAVDAAGRVYFTSNNAVYRLDTGGGLRRIAGGYATGSAGDGGLAISAQLNGPRGVAVDATGTVYIADTGNNTIRKVSPDGVITSPIGNALGPLSKVYAQPSAAVGVAIDASGTLYVADQLCQCVVKVYDGVVTALINNVGSNGVAVDAAGNLYVAGDGIQKVTPSGTVSTIVPSVAAASVAVDAAGNVYYFEETHFTFKKITPSGVVSSVVGDVPLIRVASAVDAAGNLYIADSDYRIRKLSMDGVLSTILGNTATSFYGDGEPATDALLTAGAIALGADGSLYFADGGNARVRKVASDGTISTVAGNGSPGYYADGIQATEAAVSPSSVAVDSLGNLYVGVVSPEFGGYFGSILKVGLDGVISTFAGIPSVMGGLSLALGPDGSLYVSAMIVNQILPTGAVVPVAGNGFTWCREFFEPPACPGALPAAAIG